MELKVLFLTIGSLTHYVRGQNKYEFEFLDEKVFSPCVEYPDNSIDQLIDMNNIHIEETGDGSLIVQGYALIKTTVAGPLPLSVEIFKKERGTWQPTVFTQRRVDACAACFRKTELWNSYLKNTPKEQQTCPFTEGQRLDFNITEPTYVILPSRNAEGEYKVHVYAGLANDDFFICLNIFLMVYKI